jgi:hypothetical protein
VCVCVSGCVCVSTHLLSNGVRADVELDDFEHQQAPCMSIAHFLGDTTSATANDSQVLQVL